MKLRYEPATLDQLNFIKETYNENIQALHGSPKSDETWKQMLLCPQSGYYVVWGESPVAWFRVDLEEGGFWLGMLQVNPRHHRRGVGTYILSAVEKMARAQGFRKVGIHTTEDNLPARNLYLAAGYRVTEIGPCTTGDGRDRVGYTFEKDI